MSIKLTQKQEKFCIYYHKNGNASAAYRFAYNAENMKPATVNRQAKACLDNCKIAARLAELNRASISNAVMTKQEALEILSVKARIKITDICTFKYVEFTDKETDEVYMNTVWEMKNADDIDPEVAACIKSVTFTKTGPKIELYDSTASKKLLADMLGWNAPVETKMSGELTTKNEWHIHPTSPVKVNKKSD